ncbi:peptidase domain-containing ABC transporter [Oscillatoria salina]|uniref:peptidase domain-containing ABC transporter n=1 Tax=Oscillatoria salina TaxID=331517 RepID=UPI0013B85EF5|nr:peptidase domain-containing ABC transporter [Oscillatoria salina]MBZ8180796.1 type I secretion system permease/ATPase [Oscillatoria salina IIICB1]NET88829.1 type I secretion system permease/ATPase [Kamptonema sp. SIO1D9]
MTYTKTSIKEFLAGVEPFNLLNPNDLTKLSEKLQPLRYRMGQTILLRERMPSQIALVYEGQVRLLGYDPRTQMPVTLKLMEPGEIIGWVSLLRGVPCETAIASNESICLSLNTNDFLRLIERHKEFRAYFQEKCSPLEIFELLGAELDRQALGDRDLKNLTRDVYPEAKVVYLPPGRTKVSQLEDKLWFVSGGGTVENFPPNSRLLFNSLDEQIVVKNSPARLVSVPIEALDDETEEVDLQPLDLQDDNDFTEEIADYPDEIAAAPAEPLPGQDSGKDDNRNRKYPIIRGRKNLGTAVACFQMLAQHFGMPFRKDVIRRVIGEQINRQGSVALPFCGAVAELMGLNAQLIKIPTSSITKIRVPALVRIGTQEEDKTLAVIYEVSDKAIVMGIPQAGIRRRKPAQMRELLGDEAEVLLIQETKETPKQRFGLQWFVPSLIRYRWVLMEVFIASFFVQLFALVNPLMIQVIIDKVIVQNSPDTLHVLGVFLLAIAVFEAFLSSLRTYLFVDTTNRIDMALGSEIIDHLLRLPLRYFEKRPVGELSSRVNELENIRKFLTGTALTVVLDAVFSVVYIAVMVIYSPLLTLVALATVPFFILLTLIFSPIVRKQLRVKAEKNAQTQSHLVEVLSGIQTVKAQNIELKTRWTWQERYASYVSAGFKTVVTSTGAGAGSNFLNKLAALLVLWVGANLVLSGELTLGQLIAFRIISSYVTSPLLRLAQIWQNFQETALSLERLSDIIDTPQEADKTDRQNIPMPAIKGGVKYENLSFRFKHNGPLQLNNVSVEIQPGQFVGIVGQSGAGKSTLTKLLVRLYDAEAGRILVDGYDVAKVELYSLRRQIGVVPQDTLLFDGTVQENIALTNPDATPDEIIEAATVAAAHEFIMGLPAGYNTRVGERGSSLSGGQRQRIAIARTVLQRPRMLVLDEATSALDYQTEQEVCTNLAAAFKDTTVFFITHRLGTIRNADVILMMDAGTIAEKGTHDELMALKGRYYHLFMQQESQV